MIFLSVSFVKLWLSKNTAKTTFGKGKTELPAYHKLDRVSVASQKVRSLVGLRSSLKQVFPCRSLIRTKDLNVIKISEHGKARVLK